MDEEPDTAGVERGDGMDYGPEWPWQLVECRLPIPERALPCRLFARWGMVSLVGIYRQLNRFT
ncbi:MAG: hypothetical protein ACK5ME_09930 [Parahaliea sp.]